MPDEKARTASVILSSATDGCRSVIVWADAISAADDWTVGGRDDRAFKYFGRKPPFL
jgi:hypothetical protein